MRTTRNGRSDFNNAVLFVHGIGSQQRGAYLANNAAALEMALVERGAVVELTTRGELASERMEGRDWLCWTVRYRNRTERWLIAGGLGGPIRSIFLVSMRRSNGYVASFRLS